LKKESKSRIENIKKEMDEVEAELQQLIVEHKGKKEQILHRKLKQLDDQEQQVLQREKELEERKQIHDQQSKALEGTFEYYQC
jgi:chromosome segregation ATPase